MYMSCVTYTLITCLPLYTCIVCPPPSPYTLCVYLPPLYIMCPPPSPYTLCVHLPTPIPSPYTSCVHLPPLYIMCPPPSPYISCVHLPPLYIMCPPPSPYISCVHLPTPIYHVSTSLPYISCVHLPPPIHHVSTSLPLYIMCPPPSPYTSCVHSTVMCTRQEGCVSLTKSRLDLGEVENTSGYSSHKVHVHVINQVYPCQIYSRCISENFDEAYINLPFTYIPQQHSVYNYV